MSEIRICENCNHHNSINNLECEKCGYDLSFVLPVEESQIQETEDTSAVSESFEAVPLKLVSKDKQLTIPITNEMVIGRDGVNGAYFEKSTYVSRKHAIFYIEKGETLIFDASTNGTFLNDRRLPKLQKIPIHSSDKITFADLVFEVENAD